MMNKKIIYLIGVVLLILLITEIRIRYSNKTKSVATEAVKVLPDVTSQPIVAEPARTLLFPGGLGSEARLVNNVIISTDMCAYTSRAMQSILKSKSTKYKNMLGKVYTCTSKENIYYYVGYLKYPFHETRTYKSEGILLPGQEIIVLKVGRCWAMCTTNGNKTPELNTLTLGTVFLMTVDDIKKWHCIPTDIAKLPQLRKELMKQIQGE